MPRQMLARFSKQERRLFDAAMKLAIVKGEVAHTYDWKLQKGLSIAYAYAPVIVIELHILNICGRERICTVHIVGESVGTIFDAFVKVTRATDESRAVREEIVTSVRDVAFKQGIIESGLRLSVRHRNILRDHPGF